MALAIFFHFLCAQNVSDINISIIRSLRLFCWIAPLVLLFLVRCVLEFRCGWVGVVPVLQASACNTDTKNNRTNVVIQQNSRKLLMVDILMSKTCWAHNMWNKIASDIKLVFCSSTIITVFTYYWRLQPRYDRFSSNYIYREPNIVSQTFISMATLTVCQLSCARQFSVSLFEQQKQYLHRKGQ